MRPKLAIVGIGRWGRVLLKEFSNVADIVAYYSRNSDYMDEHYPNVIRYKSFDAVMDDESIDGVIIATPIYNQGHFLEPLIGKKHIFIEKPGLGVGPNTEQNGKIVFVGYKFLYDPCLVELEGSDWLHFEWRKFGTFDSKISYNLACHDIMTAVKVLGEPVDIDVIQSSKNTLKFSILFKDNKFATFDIDRLTHKRSHTVESSKDKFKFSPDIALKNECAAFVDCINGEAKPLVTQKLLFDVFDVLKKL